MLAASDIHSRHNCLTMDAYLYFLFNTIPSCAFKYELSLLFAYIRCHVTRLNKARTVGDVLVRSAEKKNRDRWSLRRNADGCWLMMLRLTAELQDAQNDRHHSKLSPSRAQEHHLHVDRHRCCQFGRPVSSLLFSMNGLREYHGRGE